MNSRRKSEMTKVKVFPRFVQNLWFSFSAYLPSVNSIPNCFIHIE